MENNELKIQPKSNPHLRRLVAIKLGKMPTDEISEEEFSKVDEIALNSRLLNGMPSGISLDAISLFCNVRRLKLSNFTLNNDSIQAISKLPCLEQLEIFGAEFDKDINFDKMPPKLRTLKFINCLEVDFNYPQLPEVWLDNTDIDFSKIDLQTARKITIMNGRIRNAHDLTDFPNIEAVNLDGSDIFGKDEEKMEELKVSDKTIYSHNESPELINDIKEI